LQEIKRVLVVRIGRVGDLVMLTPAVQALLVKYPQAKMTILTTSDGKRVFNGFDQRIDKFILYDRKSLFPWLTRLKIKKQIIQEHYDCVYCFESKPGFLNLFTGLNSTLYTLQSTSDKNIHYSQYCLNLVNSNEPNKIENKMAFTLHLPVSDSAKKAARHQLQALHINDDDFVIGLHPSFSGLAKSFGRAKKHSHHKVWPLECWSSLAKKIQLYSQQNQLNVKIMMDLIPEEQNLGQTIKQQSHGAAIYQSPALNFERYKATLARYDLLITPNSGPMHIAAAVDTQVIALFSRHHPSDCQPFVDAEKFTVLSSEQMENSDKGLAAITPEAVFNACIGYLPK